MTRVLPPPGRKVAPASRDVNVPPAAGHQARGALLTDDPTDADDASALLGRAVKSRRLQAGLSQSALSERLGVPPGTVSEWESGSARPAPRQLLAMAEALGCPASAFFEEATRGLADESLTARIRRIFGVVH